MKVYDIRSIRIHGTSLDSARHLTVFYSRMAETMWYNPGANVAVVEGNLELTFPRVPVKETVAADVRVISFSQWAAENQDRVSALRLDLNGALGPVCAITVGPVQQRVLMVDGVSFDLIWPSAVSHR
jgi:hypothetical protein